MPNSKDERLTVTVVFLVTPEMKQDIARRAAADDRTMGDYIRRTLAKAFAAEKGVRDE